MEMEAGTEVEMRMEQETGMEVEMSMEPEVGMETTIPGQIRRSGTWKWLAKKRAV